MSRDAIERIRYRWQKFRLCRHRGTVLVDYRILKPLYAPARSGERQHDSNATP